MENQKKEILIDAFTREAVLLIAEKFKKQEENIRSLSEKIDALERRITEIYSSGKVYSQPIDSLLIERIKNLEEKVNRIEILLNSVRVPLIDKEILEKLK